MAKYEYDSEGQNTRNTRTELHGGERRLTERELEASFARLRDRHAVLHEEMQSLRELVLNSEGRQANVIPGGVTYGNDRRITLGTIYYRGRAGHRFSLEIKDWDGPW
jgi:hypothetical protein